VDVVKISFEAMKALPGCNNPIPSNNACIVGPSNLNMALDSNTNQIVPFSSDVRLLTIFPAQTYPLHNRWARASGDNHIH
jgi:hypothetical protein